MTIRRMAAALGVAAILTLGVTASAAPALAGPSSAAPSAVALLAPNNCPQLSMCGYNDGGWRTDHGYEINPVRANGTCEGVAFNDQWSSIWNGSGKTVRFFINAGCSGSSYTLANGSGSQYLTLSHPTFSDEISSYRWGG